MWLLEWFKFRDESMWVNNGEVTVEAEVNYDSSGWSGDVETKIMDVGVKLSQETIGLTKKGENGEFGIKGPSAGIEAGLKSTSTRLPELSAYGELSGAKVEVKLKLSDNVAVFGSGNLNLNTGLKLGLNGSKINWLGWGVTLGVGGRWTVDTSFGSAGATSSISILEKLKNFNLLRESREILMTG